MSRSPLPYSALLGARSDSPAAWLTEGPQTGRQQGLHTPPLLLCMAVLITGLYADGKCVAARIGGGTVGGGSR